MSFYPKIPLAQSIIQICLLKEVKHIVISPGSRNAPLTIGFVNHPFFSCYSIVDERSAAFFALGMAQQLQEPVVLVCTSGSALLNYYPAIAEAYYSQIPLIVISADRPVDKIDIGDGQTIRQHHVFSNHILESHTLSEIDSEQNHKTIALSIQKALQYKGPVHLNAPFEEPLYETVPSSTLKINLLENEPQTFEDNNINWENFRKIWNDSSKKLLLVGSENPHVVDQHWTPIVAADPSIVVLTECNSNWHHPDFISNIDTHITPFDDTAMADFQPQLLLTFGGMIVSKRIKTLLRKYKPLHHWHVDSLRAYDTYAALTAHITCNINLFFENIYVLNNKIESNYFKKNKIIQEYRKLKHNQYLQNLPFSDFKVFEYILKRLPHQSMLQIGNSSSIRYAQLFDIHPSIKVFCNRGTSGIDGCTSTAVGAAVAARVPTILISGDISFFYDNNALWNTYIPEHFKIILLNNKGGGIFRILPGHDENPVFNQFFETQHDLSAQHLAKMHQLEYFEASNEMELDKVWNTFIIEKRASILEIFTPTNINDVVLLSYFKNLK
ncbi:2-succinyl-5-enolpyruvyl-6-hydroxy-3-cyclohexene-1-carboxylic-acid synthase [Flavobacterium branchiophilum NBRC 15030 = ATCC 35035]|uniref:2-succinyl-5-enolpyruvyl-6-hydroxy-3-cyclohexene-1-carboxylate synthase n=1 Tax=Flavobacterium branchiophilum TaxID=55197 RepID=A0A543G619_9FLAO|nr:2-succinyl-5-enolpyruvyl-6-hydroxy-3-cyclohexene-1-carboxylic-acid synthase [Flavobacterium branchiophilum]OXA81109.1 2-succinyl-5-enolpyruvyl-6-hydroxy-3-cyclohexene-1-carboxylic-acid synthase [Flavobacterium branchiophilum NBRC 15030 = ATCC 35035]TQM41533.1 2-succinyl-5-enolpyruvyl-6-hydroxy-3-cyclohexene-1-carboxylate synthase [Flavobacterium branchiophilum]GEM55115.1 2-succinyl-5-enolpyruvyl-6-hydroxy-3-cyclohexene-1-carboxylate synthase [Flavobacterium branchiophilum NBRC 15030 = ATCC 35